MSNVVVFVNTTQVRNCSPEHGPNFSAGSALNYEGASIELLSQICELGVTDASEKLAEHAKALHEGIRHVIDTRFRFSYYVGDYRVELSAADASEYPWIEEDILAAA